MDKRANLPRQFLFYVAVGMLPNSYLDRKVAISGALLCIDH